jgi:hypothetical protein
MKILLYCAGISLLALSAPTAIQQAEDRDACRFTVSESTTKPSITGPEDIVAMVHVIEQPDSPIEILAMDFKDSWVSVVHERMTEQLRCTAKIRNRGDQVIRGFDLEMLFYAPSVGGPAGTGFVGRPSRRVNLAPGQEMEFQGCGGGGSGGAPDNLVRLLVFVSAIDTEGCSYFPSKRVPHQLGVAPIS